MDSNLTLRFTEWSCGHHQTRPDDIEVQTPEQALQICLAIAFAISQPGSARAVVLDDSRYFEIYLTDDYVCAGHGSSRKVPERSHWGWRPTVIQGSREDVDAIHSEPLAEALDLIHGTTHRLETLSYVEDGSIITTTLSVEEVERLAAPIDWYSGDRKKLFEVPPTFLRAADVLAELRAEKEAEDKYQAELAAEAAAGSQQVAP